MKRLFTLTLLAASMFMLPYEASAQFNFGKLLNSLVGDDDEPTRYEKLADSAPSYDKLLGTWYYSSPAIRLATENEVMSSVASSAVTSSLESKLVKAYSLVGLKEGATSFTFKDDNTFTAVVGKRTLSGTYVYDSATHKLTMEFSSLLKLGKLNGYAYLNGESLDIVFDCSRMMDFLVSLGSKTSMLKGITSIANQFDSMMIGMQYNK